MDIKRRSFLRGRITGPTQAASRPPWAVEPDALFTARCTRCGDCVRACPRQVLKTGDGGFPTIDFAEAGCSLCGDCAKSCKTGAIDPAASPIAFVWRVRIDERCLNRRGVECRVCGDACETRALRFLPARGGIAQLQVDTAACTGCGDCVAVCPVGAVDLR